jgi:hypothetical protein
VVLCRGQILVIFCAVSQKSLRTTALRAGKPLYLPLKLKNPAQIARKIELEVISSHYGKNIFSVQIYYDLNGFLQYCNQIMARN